MTEENLHLLEKLYQQYNSPVKPLLAEIESVYEKFPLALYNEIRAMNDHVARAFTAVNDKKALEQIEKAENHIYQNYQNAYNAYKDLHGFIAENRREVFSMNRKKRLKVAGSLLFSILTFIPGCIVTSNNQAIIDVFTHLFGK